MDFFQAQENARRQSRVLVGLFAAAVLSIVIGVYLTFLVLLGIGFGTGLGFDPVGFGVVAVATVGLIGGGSLVRTAQLRKGGTAVAELMGARAVDPATMDPAERRLMNVVEEMALASGIPLPAVYVMDGEPGINAFAAGYTIHDAAVAVTRGALAELNREELQGVVAHEFSHILNGDMRLNIRLMGLLFGILLLAVVGRGLVRGPLVRRRRRNERGMLLLGLALMALGYIGVFFGKLIKAGMSRQREFLADAAAVEFTRNPRGLAGALGKIAAARQGSRIRDHHAEELSHLFFANGVGNSLSLALATHPPLQERIRRLDPGEPAGAPGAGPPPVPASLGVPAPGVSGLAAVQGVTTPRDVRRAVGTTGPLHLRRASQLLDLIPPRLREATRDGKEAQSLVLALLGGDDEESERTRRTQAGGLGREVAGALPILSAALEQLPTPARLPLVDLSVGALHGLTEEEGRALATSAQAVIRANGEVRPFDFVLMHILWRHLPGRGRGGRDAPRSVRSLDGSRTEVALILSALAWEVGSGPEDVADRFQAGARFLKSHGERDLRQVSREAVSLAALDTALSRIEGAAPGLRGRVLEACAAVILGEGTDRPEHLELLRGVAESLDLPLPPH